MVQSESLDDLWLVSYGCHVQGGGASVVQGVRICPTVKQPLHGFMATDKRQQVKESASSHILILNKMTRHTLKLKSSKL